jgi:hypothetical protein
MTRLVSLFLVVSAFALAACPSDGGGGPACETDPNNCGGGPTPDARNPCGDGVCASTETPQSCPADCHVNPCGDGTCAANETHDSCPADCKCGDGVCESNETASSCPSDCQTTVDVVNSSGLTVYYLYAWSCSATTKGNNILTSALYNGYHIPLTGQAGCWNFEADGTGGSYISASYSNNLAGGQAYTWTIY